MSRGGLDRGAHGSEVFGEAGSNGQRGRPLPAANGRFEMTADVPTTLEKVRACLTEATTRGRWDEAQETLATLRNGEDPSVDVVVEAVGAMLEKAVAFTGRPSALRQLGEVQYVPTKRPRALFVFTHPLSVYTPMRVVRPILQGLDYSIMFGQRASRSVNMSESTDVLMARFRGYVRAVRAVQEVEEVERVVVCASSRYSLMSAYVAREVGAHTLVLMSPISFIDDPDLTVGRSTAAQALVARVRTILPDDVRDVLTTLGGGRFAGAVEVVYAADRPHDTMHAERLDALSGTRLHAVPNWPLHDTLPLLFSGPLLKRPVENAKPSRRPLPPVRADEARAAQSG